MALILKVNDKIPQFGKNCFLAENSTITGDVIMGNNCSVWFSAVIRGDVHYIKIGNNVNIQDGAIVHATYQKSPTNIGDNVSIAHGAIIHGCTIHKNVLIGMNAVILPGVNIGDNVVIGASSLVTTDIPSNSIAAGNPCKVIRGKSSYKGKDYRRI